MKLTKEQLSLALNKLNEYKDKRRSCSICGNNNWILNDAIFEVREFTEGNLVVGGGLSIMPLIAVSCTTCGHTRFISAIKLGLVQPSSSEPKPESQNGPANE